MELQNDTDYNVSFLFNHGLIEAYAADGQSLTRFLLSTSPLSVLVDNNNISVLINKTNVSRVVITEEEY